MQQKKKRKQYTDTRTMEDLQADEKDLRIAFGVLSIGSLLYFTVTSLMSISFLSADTAMYILVILSMIIYMHRGFERYTANLDEQIIMKDLRRIIIIIILLAAIVGLELFGTGFSLLGIDRKVTIDVMPILLLVCVLGFYIFTMRAKKKVQMEDFENEEYDDIIVKAEVEHRKRHGV